MTETPRRPLVPFADHARVERLDACRTRLPDAPELTNHIGSVHAGALFTLAETASGGAMMASFGQAVGEGVRPLVRKSEIRYLRVARGEIIATARIVEPAAAIADRLAADGRTDLEVAVVLTDADGQVVAEMDVTWNLARPRQPAAA